VSAADQLRGRVLSGLAWKAGSQILLQGSRVVVALILARLLSPHDFGLAAMALALSNAVYLLTDLGLGAALVQRPVLTDLDRSTVFWTSLGAGVVLTCVGIAVSGPIASFFGEPEVRWLFIALSFSFLITSLATIQTALLVRDMDFRGLEFRQIGGTLAGGAVGIAVAARGHGAWALITQQLTALTLSTVLLWGVSSWRPSVAYSRKSLRELGGFGANVFGTRLLIYLQRNADSLVIGRFLGATSLGLYTISSNVILLPFKQVAGPIQEVFYPAFSRMQDDVARLSSVWIRINRLVGAVTLPSLLGLIVVAPDFVPVVLGRRWDSAVPVIQILAWAGALQSLQRLNSGILQARNRTGTLLRYSLVAAAGSVTALFAGLPWGIVGVAVACAIATSIVEPYYWWLTARALDLSLGAFLRSLSGVLQAALAMAACSLAGRLVLAEVGVTASARLVIVSLFGVMVFVPLCLWRAPEVRRELRTLRGLGWRGASTMET
jgi:polysaccharide transporter, PST family